jgi:hypothetical protein
MEDKTPAKTKARALYLHGLMHQCISPLAF